MNVLGFDLSAPILVIGLVIGMTYGLIAVGLVIVYRVSKVINFAQGAIGTVGAAVLGMLVTKYGVPYWIAAVAGIAAAAAAGAVAELAVVRRLASAPKVMSLVATLGLAAFFSGVAAAIYGGVEATDSYPEPTGFPTFELGALIVTPSFSAALILSPLLVIATALVLRYTRFGVALRAASANPGTARALGVRVSRMSLSAWMIAGGFAAFTAILVFPSRGFTGGEAFGPSLMLRALAAAVVARMTSLPIALAAGVGIGVVEQVLYYNVETPGVTTVFLFLLIFTAVLLQRRGEGRTRADFAWASVAADARLVGSPEAVRIVRRVSIVCGLIVLALAIALPAFSSNSTAIGMASVLGLAIVALSVGVVTGQGGHLSLGQFAFAGIAAAYSLKVVASSGNYLAAFLVAGFVGAIAAVIVGIPALRVRGIMYAVTTLAFAYMCENYLLRRPFLFGDDAQFPRPVIFGRQLESGASYYWFSLGVLLLALWLIVLTRRGGLSRTFIALRDNEDAARSLTIPSVLRTLQLFALGGFVAGLGGAVYAYASVYVSPDVFNINISIDVVAAAVIGGLGFVAGPLVGALYIFAVPQFVNLDSAALAGTALGWLLLLLYLPGGLGSLVFRARDSFARRVERRLERRAVASSSSDADPATGAVADAGAPDKPVAQAPGLLDVPLAKRTDDSAAPEAPEHDGRDDVILRLDGVSKAFGGLKAVDDVSLEVKRGEILGIIGPNGAGKTTLFEIVSGFLSLDVGTVQIDGRDVAGWTPERLARAGVARSFQDSRLFPTMTVHEALMLSQERYEPITFFGALFGGPKPEAERRRRADELVELMGLQQYAEKRISQLSTGTRRIAELACVMSMRPSLLLLDEPSSGIAQRESESLGDLLRAVRDYLGATLVIIEHDVPLISGLSDRLAAMESGRLLIVDTPDVVISDPRVIEAYLGGDVTAIQRSGGALLAGSAG